MFESPGVLILVGSALLAMLMIGYRVSCRLRSTSRLAEKTPRVASSTTEVREAARRVVSTRYSDFAQKAEQTLGDAQAQRIIHRSRKIASCLAELYSAVGAAQGGSRRAIIPESVRAMLGDIQWIVDAADLFTNVEKIPALFASGQPHGTERALLPQWLEHELLPCVWDAALEYTSLMGQLARFEEIMRCPDRMVEQFVHENLVGLLDDVDGRMRSHHEQNGESRSGPPWGEGIESHVEKLLQTVGARQILPLPGQRLDFQLHEIDHLQGPVTGPRLVVHFARHRGLIYEGIVIRRAIVRVSRE